MGLGFSKKEKNVVENKTRVSQTIIEPTQLETLPVSTSIPVEPKLEQTDLKILSVRITTKLNPNPPPEPVIEARDFRTDSRVDTSLRIELLPHQHTLFCERKQRVCSAVGKLQELEILQVFGLKETQTFVWVRSHINDINPHNNSLTATPLISAVEVTPSVVSLSPSSSSTSPSPHQNDDVFCGFEYLPLTLNQPQHSLTRGDVFCYLFVKVLDEEDPEDQAELQRIERKREDWTLHPHPSSHHSQDECVLPFLPPTNSSPSTSPSRACFCSPVGPILPGPPRLLSLSIHPIPPLSSDSLLPGMRLEARAEYIGGWEGASEYWWMRVRDGERELLGEPRPVPLPLLDDQLEGRPTDPRIYLLTPEDVGCELKVKCRPVRRDGYQGEIFTSQASDEIRSQPDPGSSLAPTVLPSQSLSPSSEIPSPLSTDLEALPGIASFESSPSL